MGLTSSRTPTTQKSMSESDKSGKPELTPEDRKLGYYHCRWVDEWVIARWNGYEWMHEGVRVLLIFDEIDERRIERSHSPTEQPGDAKHTPGPYETGQVLGRTIQDELFYYDVYKHSGPIRRRVAQAYGVDQKEAEANAELIARAPALLSEVSTLRSKQAELVAENERLNKEQKMQEDARSWDLYYRRKAENKAEELEAEAVKLRQRLNKGSNSYAELKSENAKQAAELEQLRSERDKMREGWKSP